MFNSIRLALVFVILLSNGLSNDASAQQNGGEPIAEAQLSELDLIVEPDGSGLPNGSGSAIEGKNVYDKYCQTCHGALGEGATASLRLAGGDMHSTTAPIKTVGSYWPHATTLFDYIRRAMPTTAPKSLTNQEVYQVTAYILFLSDIIAEDFVIDNKTLPAIVMPNRDGFIDKSKEH